MMKLIRLKEVRNKTGLSKATLYRQIAAGKLPMGIQIAYRAVAWEEDKIDEWLIKKASESQFKLDQA